MTHKLLINILPQPDFHIQYLNILPPDYKLYYFQESTSYYIYISNEKLKGYECRTNTLNVIGYINFIISDDHEITIEYIQSNRPGAGVGQYLLLITAYIAKIHGINRILLDDMSDNARQKNNIYRNISCTYIVPDPSTEPEMECDANTMLNKYSVFYEKYVNNPTKPHKFFKDPMQRNSLDKKTRKTGKTGKTETRKIGKIKGIEKRK